MSLIKYHRRTGHDIHLHEIVFMMLLAILITDGLIGKLDCGFKQQIDPETCYRSKIMHVQPGCPEEKKISSQDRFSQILRLNLLSIMSREVVSGRNKNIIIS